MADMAEIPVVDYSGTMSKVYNTGRSLSLETLAWWADMAAEHLVVDSGVVCDLGAGTGRFAGTLADRLGRRVVAVEPSEAMRAQIAQPVGVTARVSVVAGRAEAVPLRAECCALVWMSQAIHHVEDLDACGRELRRILIPGGQVLLRGLFEVRGSWVLAPYFPTATTLVEQHFPSLDRIAEAFSQAALRLQSHTQCPQAVARDGHDLLARTRLRADSALARIPDDQFVEGLDRLGADVSADAFQGPIVEMIDLVSFG